MAMVDLSQEPASKQDIIDLESRLDNKMDALQKDFKEMRDGFIDMKSQLGSVKWMVPIVSATNVALVIVTVGLVSGFMGKMLGWY